ncbi:MAG: ABC transporter permease subunit [Spirochaetales bacterium]|nr:MAG: ABC transporter permease subunit [Spirochaetales bacterium]
MVKKKLPGYILTILSTAVLLCIWKVFALILKAEIILPPPETVLLQMIRLFGTYSFWQSVGATLFRGLFGFFLSAAAGLLTGVAAGMSRPLYLLLKPLLSVIKTTPVMSIVIIALIWFTAGSVPVFTAFLVAYPVIAGNVMEGIRNVDKNLIKMAEVFRVPRKRVLSQLYLPSTLPYFAAGASTSLGLTWKVIIAGEVLAQPLRGLGTGLIQAKQYLETAEVFAWTVCAIILSAGTEGLFNFLLDRIPWKRRDPNAG